MATVKNTADVKHALLTRIAQSRDQLVSIAQSLIQQPSTNPPGDVTNVAQKVVDLLTVLIPSISIQTYETGPGITNVVGVLRGAGEQSALGRSRPKRLVFSGHLDTYGVGDPSKWTVDPFRGAISPDGKKLYGRGSSDMKGGIAASIVAMHVLANYSKSWGGEIIIALAGDEETMGHMGSAWLLENVEEVKTADAMICGDAGSPRVIRIGEKGLVWIEVMAEGRSAHGAHVHKGVNAIDRLLDALHAIKKLEALKPEFDDEIDIVIARARSILEPDSGAGESAVLSRVTINVGTIEGGTSPNLVPDSARAALDIRLPFGVLSATIVRHVQNMLDPMEAISYRILQRYDPTFSQQSHSIVRHSLNTAKDVVSEDAVVNMRVGASDARLFRARGIPSVVVGLTPYNMGGPDEHIAIDELVQVSQVHALTAFEFFQDG